MLIYRLFVSTLCLLGGLRSSIAFPTETESDLEPNTVTKLDSEPDKNLDLKLDMILDE